MKRRLLSAREVDALTEPGRYACGHGLYLQISNPWRTRAWVFRYTRNGKPRYMGLGSAEYVRLAQAREKAFALRQQMALDGAFDPLEAKRMSRHGRMLAGARDKTFRQCALDCIAAHEDGWRGDRSRRQWIESLTNHVFPRIGNVPVGAVDVAAVLSVLDPISRDIPETAKRVKSRIATILDWAAARDLRPHDNPARRPNLLPKRKRHVKHLAAMPYADVPTFMAELCQRPEMSARALEFAVLTAARPGEALGARWSEIDLAEAVWAIPGERIKGGRAHRVPLSGRAVELLANLPREGEYLFPGRYTDSPHAHTAPIKLLRRMGHAVTAHGFRSTFRDWAAEVTAYPNHVVEQALAHAIGNGVEAAYRRGDLFEKRRRLMQDWGDYCGRAERAPGHVVPLRGDVRA
jgi:integrase